MNSLLDMIPATTIEERFRRFHEANPHVFEKLVELAREVKRSGMKRCGISFLWERARWFWAVETNGDDYRLNNVFRSRYARLLIETYPDEFGNGFFETRVLKAE